MSSELLTASSDEPQKKCLVFSFTCHCMPNCMHRGRITQHLIGVHFVGFTLLLETGFTAFTECLATVSDRCEILF